MERVSNPLAYYRQHPEAQGLLSVSPELDLLDMATGGGKMAMAAAAKKAVKKKIEGYHGTPHSFNQFDFSHMGSGEGAQAYGWGGYLAELEDTSIGYRDALSGGKKVSVVDGVRGVEPTAMENWVFNNYGGDAKKAYKRLSESPRATEVKDKLLNSSKVDELGLGFSDYDIAKMDFDNFQAKLNEIKALEGKKLTFEPAGHMYEVEVNANPDELLDWDKPISQQSSVIKDASSKFIEKYSKGIEASRIKSILGDDPTGEDLYELPQFLSQNGGLLSSNSPKATSEYLDSIGVKGIKYADGNSRNADWQLSTPDTTVSGKWMVKDANKPNSKGLQYENEFEARDALGKRGETSNYVVFNDKIMKIAKKYGVSLPVASSMLYGSQDESKGLLNQKYSDGTM